MKRDVESQVKKEEAPRVISRWKLRDRKDIGECTDAVPRISMGPSEVPHFAVEGTTYIPVSAPYELIFPALTRS